MQQPTKAAKAATINSFAIEDDHANLRIVDRSTLEAYADCPASARMVETGAVLNRSSIMEVGNEVHHAISQAIGDYIDSKGALSASDVQDAALAYLFGSRPDLQPEVVRAMRASLYHWSRYVGGIHHDNILAYDGGQGAKSGQLAFDMPDLRLRLTSEVDLLHAGPAAELLHETDYKTGHKLHTAQSVADSFQFQLHAVLVFENWPDVQALEVVVWNTRTNRKTWKVEFKREQKGQFMFRVRRAAETYAKHCEDIPALAPYWPTIEKCGRCPAAAFCPATGDDRMLLEWDPSTFIDETVALAAKADARLALMSAMVKRTGRDLLSASGNAYGAKKPKKPRAPTLELYEVEPSDESEPDDA